MCCGSSSACCSLCSFCQWFSSGSSTAGVPMIRVKERASDGTYFRCRYSDSGCRYRYRNCDARGECNDYQLSRRQLLELDSSGTREVDESATVADNRTVTS